MREQKVKNIQTVSCTFCLTARFAHIVRYSSCTAGQRVLFGFDGRFSLSVRRPSPASASLPTEMMHMRPRTHAALLCALPALALAACNAAPTDTDPSERTANAAQPQITGVEMPAHFERLVPWGSGDEGFALHPPGYQDPARGPAAVAVAPTGAALVLDQLGGRVAIVGAEGKPATLAEAPMDAADLVAGSDGAFAVWSKVRSRAWFHEPDGTRSGELSIPRSFIFLQRISMGPSGSLQLHTAGQNTIVLGTPDAPTSERAARLGRRYGAPILPVGRGVFAGAHEGKATLTVLAQPSGGSDKPSVVATHAVPGEVTALRIIGAYHTTVCARLERVTSTPEINVDRRAFCMDLASGAVVLDEALPRPGLYAPRSELAMNGGRMAFILPTEQGLQVTGWRVPASTNEEVQP